MAITKNWVLNDRLNPLFKVDYDSTGDNSILNGGILYGGGAEGLGDFLVKDSNVELNNPLVNDSYIQTANKINLGCYDPATNSSRSVQDNIVNLSHIKEEAFRNVFEKKDIGYYNSMMARESEYGIFDIGYKTSYADGRFSYLTQKLKDAVRSSSFPSYITPYGACLYIGHILTYYKYALNGSVNTFSPKESFSGVTIPILYWCCVSNGANRCNAIQYSSNTYSNRLNLKVSIQNNSTNSQYPNLCLFYDKETGLCVMSYRYFHNNMNLQSDVFNSAKDFLYTILLVQEEIGYIVIPPTY